MKKNYMRPESTVMKIETIVMSSTSAPSVTVNPGDSGIDASDVESRSYNDWDD